MRATRLSFLVVWLVSAALPGAAQVPGIINYQGKFLVSGTNYSGTCQFKFALVNGAGDTTYWSHNGTSVGGGEPSGSAIALGVSGGLFSVNLGDSAVPNMTSPIPLSIFANSQVWLRVWVYDPVKGSQKLSPDQRLTAVGYAMVAGTALGPVADSQLSANVARLNATQTFSGANTFSNVSVRGALSVFGGPARLDLVDGAQTWRVQDDAGDFYVSDLTRGKHMIHAAPGGTEVDFPNGVIAGNGAGLTNLNAANIAGTLPGGLIEASLPSGMMVASMSSQDPVLLSKGYQRAMSVAAPPWVDGSATDAPSARTGHSAVWDGQELIVWGGNVSAGYVVVNTGAMYRPDLDTWTAMSLFGAPSPRSGHTAVWSGVEMLVWGGNGTNAFLNTGARFQPATQVWTVIATNSAPAVRSGHLAAWTGSRMVIWGGRNNNGLLGDGAVYDPAAGAWSALNLANAPEARSGAGGVWAGDRLLVWGGEGTNGVLGSGSQLLCAANGTPLQWTPMSQSGAPAARRLHSAVWTGRQLLVWGGQSGGTVLGDGAAYDPAADSWQMLSATNAPAARYNHAAIWTGQEMLILGGSAGSSELASGAAYDPVGRQWRSLSNAGNPQARSGATAVWSGTEALFFGGQAAATPLAWLQRLDPQPAWYLYRKP